MNKTALFILILLFGSPSSQAAELLRIGTDDWPPYEYLDAKTGSVTGYSTELIQRVLQQMQLEIGSLQIYPWARVEQEALAGNIDILYTLNPSEKRRSYLYFPDEPLDTDYGTLFVKNEQLGKTIVNSLEDLYKYSVAVVRGYQYSPEVRAFIESSEDVVEVTDETQLFSMLARNRVDAVISYRNVGQAIIKRLNLGDQITALEQPLLFSTRYYAAFSRKSMDIKLVQRFSDALADYKKTEAYQALRAKYFGH